MSFRQRVVLLSAAAAATAVLLASGLAYVVVRHELRGQVDNDLRALAREIEPLREVTIPDTGQTVLVLPTEPLLGSQGYAQIVRPDGAVIRPPGSKVNVPVTPRVLKVATGKEDPFFEDADVDGVHTRVLTGRLENGDAVQAAR
jgi:hypothetical protein